MSYMYVRIHYGPCECFHTYIHRPQRLKGLRVALQKLGYRVDLVPTNLIELCSIEMCGYEVFRCNIKNLQFNMAEPRDPVAKRAVQAVVEAGSKMQRARHYLWAWTLIESQMFKNIEYAPKSYWKLYADFKPMNRTCADCCHILLAGQPEEVSERSSDKYFNAQTHERLFARD